MFEIQSTEAKNEISIQPHTFSIDILASANRIELPTLEEVQRLRSRPSKDLRIVRPDNKDELLAEIVRTELVALEGHPQLFESSDKFKYRVSSLFAQLGDFKKEAEVLSMIPEGDRTDFVRAKIGKGLLRDDLAKGLSYLSGVRTVEATVDSAMALLQVQDLDSAETLVSSFYSSSEHDLRINQMYALVELIKGDYASAIRLMRESNSIGGIIDTNAFLLALSYYYSRSPEKAKRWAEIGLNLNPVNIDLLTLYSSMNFREDVPRVIRYLEVYNEVRNDRVVKERLAKFYYMTGRNEPVISLLQELLVEDDKNYSIWNNLALVFKRIGDPKKALRFFLVALKTLGERIEPTVISNVMRFLDEIGDYKMLADIYTSMEFGTRVPLDFELYRNIHSIYLIGLIKQERFAEYEEAIGAMRLKSNEVRLTTLILNDLVFYHSGYRPDAQKLAEVATNLQEAFFGLSDREVRLRVCNNLVFSLLECDLPIRKDLFDTFRSNMDKNPYYTATFGLFQLKIGNSERGIEYYNKAIQLTNDSSLVRKLKAKRDLETGFLLYRGQNFKGAVRFLEKVARLEEEELTRYADQAKDLLRTLKEAPPS